MPTTFGGEPKIKRY
ncbi:hypothetical protein [Staphylococcus aureus]